MRPIDRVIQNVIVRHPEHGEVKVTAHRIGRDNKNSPYMLVFEYNGRMITPFEQRVRKWQWTLATFARLHYSNQPIMELLCKTNPLFDDIPYLKNEGYTGETDVRSTLPKVFRRK